MNETQARTIREAHDAYVKRIHRLPKAQLATMYRAEQADRGIQMLYGGPASKDELISALVELRYPRAKMNEAIHVLYHQDFASDVCEYCNPDPCPVCGALSTCTYQDGGPGIVNGRHLPRIPEPAGDDDSAGWDRWNTERAAMSARLTDA